MTPNQLCIATITLARTTEEEQLLKSALTVLATKGYTIFITDGSSLPSFAEWLQTVPQFRLVPMVGKGVQAQAISSLLAAYEQGTPYVLYAEPDKLDFFSRHLSLTNLVIADGTGVALFARSAKAFASFPAFQQKTETAINQCCAEVMGERLDYTYGPFVLHRDIVPQLRHLKQDVGWGWRPYTFNLARRMGFAVTALEGDYECPPSQRGDDAKERLYRMKQLEQNIRGIVLSAEAELL